MNRFSFSAILALAMLILAACSGEMPVEKAIVGNWVQEVPVSMSDEGLQTTISDTAMRFEKDGDITRRSIMTLRGRDLPADGIVLDIELTGTWALQSGQLIQTPQSALVTPRSQTDTALAWAESWQKEADAQSVSTKIIVAADKKQLILQDVQTGSTDVYRRK